jgi:hypothetical protein
MSGRPVIAVPTSSWRPGDFAHEALMTGTLAGGRVGSGEYCVWVTRESGEAIPVVWPAGFRARLDPLELLNAEGAVVARAGDKLSVGGGAGPVEPGDPCSLGEDGAFYVMDEIPVSPSHGSAR